VALHTLYLPPSVKSLMLTQANALTTLLKTEDDLVYTTDAAGNVIATQGLYLQDFFGDNTSSEIASIYLNGGALGYGSYEILKQFYNKKKNTTGSKLTMIDVNWSPYVQCVEGDVDDGISKYYIDDDHYGFIEYDRTNNTTTDFMNYILNGKIYKYTGEPDVVVNDDFVKILKDLKINKGFSDHGTGRPIISGIVYVENETPLEEAVEIK
jgi:hypothetical protein